MGPFTDIRTVDLSRVLAGPYCGQLLADYGSEVIKVEPPGGDENRLWPPVSGNVGANFASVNRGKRGMTLDLKTASGQAILKALVAKSDVVIDSFLPDVAKRLGVDDETLRDINPNLIHVTISGYGHLGPLAQKPGYDLMLQAFTGIMQMTGEPDSGPVRAGPSIIDMATGMLAFAGTSAALYAKAAGHAGGQHVRVSLLQTAFSLMGYHVAAWTMAGKKPRRDGSGVWHIVPYQAFETTDGHVLVGATNDRTWQKLCAAIGLPDLAINPDYATAAARVENRSALIQILADVFSTKSTQEWIVSLEPAGVPCAPVNEMCDALAHPQIAAMNVLSDATGRDGTAMRLLHPPISLSSTTASPGAPPPSIGEDTEQILADLLSMDRVQIDRLRAEGAI